MEPKEIIGIAAELKRLLKKIHKHDPDPIDLSRIGERIHKTRDRTEYLEKILFYQREPRE